MFSEIESEVSKVITRQEVIQIVQELCMKISALFPGERIEAILFGSYAREEAEIGSDIDVMILVDSSRQEILEKNWSVGNIAGEILLDYGIVISPVIENRDYFRKNSNLFPFYRNVNSEGVRISA